MALYIFIQARFKCGILYSFFCKYSKIVYNDDTAANDVYVNYQIRDIYNYLLLYRSNASFREKKYLSHLITNGCFLLCIKVHPQRTLTRVQRNKARKGSQQPSHFSFALTKLSFHRFKKKKKTKNKIANKNWRRGKLSWLYCAYLLVGFTL